MVLSSPSLLRHRVKTLLGFALLLVYPTPNGAFKSLGLDRACPCFVNMKTIKFKSFKAQWILDGTKRATIRLFDDKDLQVNDELEFINSDTGESFGKAIITEVAYKILRDIDDVDLEGHEKWNNKKEMIKSLKVYYGHKVNLNTEVKIIKFKLL